MSHVLSEESELRICWEQKLNHFRVFSSQTHHTLQFVRGSACRVTLQYSFKGKTLLHSSTTAKVLFSWWRDEINNCLCLFSPRPRKLRIYGLDWANYCGLMSGLFAELWALVLYTLFICSQRWFEPLWWFFHKYKQFIPQTAVPAQQTNSSPVSYSSLTTSRHTFRQVGCDSHGISLSLHFGEVLSCLTSAVTEEDVKHLLTVWAPSHSHWEGMVLSGDCSCEGEQVAHWRCLPFPVGWWGESWTVCAVDDLRSLIVDDLSLA